MLLIINDSICSISEDLKTDEESIKKTRNQKFTASKLTFGLRD